MLYEVRVAVWGDGCLTPLDTWSLLQCRMYVYTWASALFVPFFFVFDGMLVYPVYNVFLHHTW